MARKVRQIRGKGNHVSLVPVPSMAAPDLDTRIALIQALIPVALEKVHAELQADVARLAGERYVREGRRPGHVRWTAQRGSIYLADQKIPLVVPRVRDRLRNQEVALPTYARLQVPRTLDAGLLHKVLGGLSTREYERCAEAVPEAFGLSASTVSRRFKRASARKLQELLERRLERYDVVALLLDGKTFAEDEMVAAVGVTITGEKVLLGFVQTATENRKVCAAFLRELVEDRGLRTDLGLLVVTDGAKGLHAAVREVLGTAALLQRCQWHKRENVLAYLPERHRPTLRRKLQAAYEQPTYEAAKRALGKVRAALVLLNSSAVGSLDEGLEETLTLHRLGVFRELGTSLKTTNALESIHARVESRVAKVDHWKNSDQKQRWLATALLDLEPRLRRIKNFRALPLLRAALTRQIEGMKKAAA
jgi:transposase-like protein